ncbi:MAG: tetratricopeptide repeat protein [Gemmatimonadales bacterium]
MDVSHEQLLEQAKERFELQDYYGAIHIVEELIEHGRAYADAHNLLGLAYQLVDQPERALEAFEHALKLNPHYVDAHINRGVVLASLGRSEEAAEDFAVARRSGGERREGVPSHHAARLANKHAELGEAYAEAGQLSQAIEQYREALKLGPTFHDLRYRMGQLLLEAGRSLEAREEFEQVMKARPHSGEAKGSYGMACYLAGDPQSARAVWEKLARERPDDPRARAYLAMLERAE